ncbi:MAG: TolC family protein [Spirochaetales bacterium]|nr:TolC family protein [Spirochaetales bacterium]
MRKAFLVLLLFLTAAVFQVTAEETLEGIDAVRSYALEHNLTYRTAVWEALKARNNIEGIFTLDKSSLSLSGNWNDIAANPLPELEAGVSLPILEQVAFNASLDSDLKGRLGIVLTPLAHSSSDEQAELAYQKALALADETALSVENDTLAALLRWSATERKTSVQEKVTALREQLYQDDKTRYAAGEATLDEVRSSLKAWSEARVQLTTLQNQLQQTVTNLYALLHTEPAEVSVTQVETEELLSSLQVLLEETVSSSGNPSSTWQVTSTKIEARKLQLELQDIWLFDPDLKVNAGLDIDLHTPGISSVGGSVTLSVGLQDFRSEEKEELTRDIGLAEEQIALAVAESNLAYKQAMGSLENANLARQIVELELEETRELADESAFLYDRGEISAAELEEARLLLLQADNDYFSALADQFIALLELRRYMD